MYFQIATSPVKPVKKQSITPLEDVAVLKLAPFSPNPKIFFENVAVGEVETKKLIIQNPNPFRNNVTITKLPPPDRFVTLSWNEAQVEAQEEIILEIIWAPKEEGGWRDVISIQDIQNVTRNIPIVFKSIPKKGKKRTTGKPNNKAKPRVVSVPAVKKFRSPKNTKKKRSPQKIPEQVCMPQSFKCENCEGNIHVTTCSPIKKKTSILESNKENSPVILQPKFENPSCVIQHKFDNLSPIIFQQKCDNVSFSKLSSSEKLNRMDNSSIFSSPSTINFKCENIAPTPVRRETYLIRSPDNFNDSLELEKKLDNLQLTPEVPAKSNIKKINIHLSPELYVKNNKNQFAESCIKKLSIDSSPEVSMKNNKNNLAESFINKLSLDFTPDMSARSNKGRTSDHFLVQKLLSDSFTFSTATVTKKTSNFQYLLNDTQVMDDNFFPNNSTEYKNSEKGNRNNNQSSTPKELFKPNNTYELSPAHQKYGNQDNLSGDTYSLSNISSSSTYNILSPDDFHHRLREHIDHDRQSTKISTSSPLPHAVNQFHSTSNYLNFSGINAKNALSCITEEDQSEQSIKNVSMCSDTSNIGTKRKSEQPEMIFTISPPKRAFIKPKSPKPVKNVNTSWSKKLEKTERIRRKSVSTLRLNLSKSSSKSNISEINTTSINMTQSSCNIDPFLIAAMYNSNTSTVNTNLDPFISSTLYYDESWLDKQTQELKKWLNALLTPPSELVTTTQSKKVDVAKLWQDCVKKDLMYAPSKEKVSSKYHTNHKLEILRKSAKNLFHSLEIRSVLSKVAITIESKQMCIREDKNLHLDVGLQSHILTLLLCYNPLWLRIGLETIYNESIPLDSNSDVIGLSTFIMLRFFRCPDLLPKNKQSSHIKYLPAYSAAIKKFTLKKFLMLVYFLDQGKNKKLISHDPCLFCKDAPVKESKELLLSFSRELLSAVGDITKFLRRLGYEVSHKQNYIDEFDYAVKNLGIDLRDGIILTKVMEIILLRNDLTNQLRGPAISRLQKIHNVKLALDSLHQVGYTIAGDITPKDIVDGHREKTLSLLWQIIYKFQAPRFTAAASKIQIWWKSLRIVIKRRILDRPRQLRISAAIKIQQYYRGWKLMIEQRSKFLIIKKSAVILQRFIRSIFLMKRDRLQYLLKKQAVIIIQQRYRARNLMKMERNYYLNLKNAAINIQRHFRAKSNMKQDREYYLKLRDIVTRIQKNFRSKQLVKEQRNNFLQQKSAAVFIQRRFRANILMRKDRDNYLHTRNVIIKLQERIRAILHMKSVRHAYLKQRKCIILVQQKYRAIIQGRKVRKSYLEQRQAIIKIQQRYRTYLKMKQVRKIYLQQKEAAIVIQKYFKSYLLMKNTRLDYIRLKQASKIIQSRFRANLLMKSARKNYIEQRNAAILIQRKFKAQLEMKKCRKQYDQLKNATVFIQNLYRANVAMKKCKESYLHQLNAAITLQKHFKAYLIMKKHRNSYLKLKQFTILIQQRFRATLIMKTIRKDYLQQRNAIIFIQQKYRANMKMKLQRDEFSRLKKATLNIQRRFRANVAMQVIRKQYLQQRNAAIVIQRKFRSYLEMKKCHQDYLNIKKAALIIQQRYRAQIVMKKVRNNYIKERNAIQTIQRKFRAYREMKKCRQNYLKLKDAALVIQYRFRANLEMKKCRECYLQQRKSAIIIQQRFRATSVMKKCRSDFLKLKQIVVFTQQQFRANQIMKTTRNSYILQRNSIIIIQRKFRAYLQMKTCRENYTTFKQNIIFLQRKYRANKAMQIARENYAQQRNAILLIQKKFRAYKQMKTCVENYKKLKEATLYVQRRFRNKLLMKNEQNQYRQQRDAVIIIQRHIRNYLQMKKCRQNYLKLKKATLYIQTRYRAHLSMKKERERYLQQKNAAKIIQHKFRAYLDMKLCRDNYLLKKRSCCVIQKRFREYLLMKKQQTAYLKMKKSAILIQNRFRSLLLTKKCREEFIQKKEAAIKIQRYFRLFIKKRLILKMKLKIKAVIKIQSLVRMYLAKKKLIQLRENAKETEEIKAQRRLNNMATRIQSIWRGYKTRKTMCKKLALIRQRSVEATNNAQPESTVSQRNREAIDLLMYNTSMKEIIRALTILDFTTRLFPNLCIEVCDEITERLYILLLCTNRSVPDMDASILCVSVLINLYKFQPTSTAVWKVQYIERLLSILLHWSDKDGHLFPYVSTLIWLFSHKSEYSKVILAQENVDKILKKTYQQCERRQKMLSRMRNAPVPLHVKGQKDVFPSLVPDWGILNVNRPRVFQNSIFAAKCLLKKLNISLNI